MPVNIVNSQNMYMDERDLPREFEDVEAAKNWLREQYQWIENLDDYAFTFPEVVPCVLHLPQNLISKCTEGYLESVFEFARTIKFERQLQRQLDVLGSYGENSNTYVVLYDDWAPYSFFWNEKLGTVREVDGNPVKIMDDKDKVCMVGGLIFHGNHDNGGDGSSATYSVSLVKGHGWSIHT